MTNLKEAITTTIIFYLFGAVCAGNFDVSEWNSFWRVVLAIIWLIVVSDD